jgi:hypothetical protein
MAPVHHRRRQEEQLALSSLAVLDLLRMPA